MDSKARIDLHSESAASVDRWIHDESGVTAIEYGLIAALIAVFCIGAITATGVSLTQLYTDWSTAVINAL
jgi:pilus assembly protein Flp/PilA